MGEITDEFEIADSLSKDEIKDRVNSWMTTDTGLKFSLELVSDDQVILKRVKRDPRAFCTICLAFIVAPLYLGAMDITGIGSSIGFFLILSTFIAAAVVSFFLFPKRAAYTLVFDYGSPTCVRVNASIRILESIAEYYSLKVRLRNPTQEQGPVIGA